MVACQPVQTGVTNISSTKYPEKPMGSVIPILSETPNDRTFDEIAILNSVANTSAKLPLVSFFDPISGKLLDDMRPRLLAAACKVGADAILIKNAAPGSHEAEANGKTYALAIKFLD